MRELAVGTSISRSCRRSVNCLVCSWVCDATRTLCRRRAPRSVAGGHAPNVLLGPEHLVRFEASINRESFLRSEVPATADTLDASPFRAVLFLPSFSHCCRRTLLDLFLRDKLARLCASVDLPCSAFLWHLVPPSSQILRVCARIEFHISLHSGTKLSYSIAFKEAQFKIIVNCRDETTHVRAATGRC